MPEVLRPGCSETNIRIAVSLAKLVPGIFPDFVDVPALGQAAEEWGSDTLAIGEHVAWFDRMQHPGGELLNPELMASLSDAFAVLSALAARTTSIRLMTSALVGGLRHPLLIARAAASVERLSGGRFDLGLAPGWSRAEYQALGVPFEERHARLRESLAVYEALWAQDRPCTFAGNYYSFAEVRGRPFPSSPIPLWLGGPPSATTAKTVARYAVGWLSRLAAPPKEVAAGVAAIAAACAEAGRDPREVQVTAQLGPDIDGFDARGGDRAAQVEVTVRAVRELIGAGATQVVLPVADLAGSLDGIGELVSGVVEAVHA